MGRQLNREVTLRLPASQGGRGLGLEGRANSGEALLSRRDVKQAKEAERRSLTPSGNGTRAERGSSPTVSTMEVGGHPRG